MDSIIGLLIAVLALLITLSTHEYCHALVAFLLGDESAKRAGRLTMNPLAHIDPVGTVLMPLIGMMSGIPLIAWAKPVPYNPYNLRYRKWGPTLVALSGPVSNFLLALVYLVLLKAVIEVFGLSVFPRPNLLVVFLFFLVIYNVVLGIFNFIPVPPLDGSKLLQALLDSPKYRHILFFLETRGPMILLFLILLDYLSPRSFLGAIFNGAIAFVFSLAGLERLLVIL
jgi:Zn-dependent protease